MMLADLVGSGTGYTVGAVALLAAGVVCYALRLLFCWLVYRKSGDVDALSRAGKIGRLRR